MSVITIARQFGAGGKTLGTRVAESLGYTLIDEQIVEMVALEADVAPELVDSIAQETGHEGIVQRLIRRFGPFSKGYVETAMEERPGYVNGDLYIALLHKVIPIFAEQGNVVIIGRGGQYILAERPDTFHFLMIANIENRIKFMMEHYKIDRKKAQAVIDKQNKRRINLYRYFGRTDYDQPELYHLVLNMNRLRLDDAVQAVCRLVAG
ncbi:MAG: cytidylate kinase-like family protein [Desulfofustis sp.]|jgi:cytidylate kinase